MRERWSYRIGLSYVFLLNFSYPLLLSLTRRGRPITHLIFDMRGVNAVDLSGLHMLEATLEILKS